MEFWYNSEPVEKTMEHPAVVVAGRLIDCRPFFTCFFMLMATVLLLGTSGYVHKFTSNLSVLLATYWMAGRQHASLRNCRLDIKKARKKKKENRMSENKFDILILSNFFFPFDNNYQQLESFITFSVFRNCISVTSVL